MSLLYCCCFCYHRYHYGYDYPHRYIYPLKIGSPPFGMLTPPSPQPPSPKYPYCILLSAAFTRRPTIFRDRLISVPHSDSTTDWRGVQTAPRPSNYTAPRLYFSLRELQRGRRKKDLACGPRPSLGCKNGCWGKSRGICFLSFSFLSEEAIVFLYFYFAYDLLKMLSLDGGGSTGSKTRVPHNTDRWLRSPERLGRRRLPHLMS